MSGPFTLARPGGDTRGPVLVGGSAAVSPLPIRRGKAATLTATFTDAEMGGGGVSAAEYSTGAAPAPAGGGRPMSGAFGGTTVQASSALPTNTLPAGNVKFWLRARDAGGNWGAATALTVTSTGGGTVAVEEPTAMDFLSTPSPNPSRELATIHFGLAHAGEVNLEVFDVTGRRVQTLIRTQLSPGPHSVTWNGRDERGSPVRNGVYFVRLTTAAKTLDTRMVRMQ
jgi:hypothetical protein